MYVSDTRDWKVSVGSSEMRAFVTANHERHTLARRYGISVAPPELALNINGHEVLTQEVKLLETEIAVVTIFAEQLRFDTDDMEKDRDGKKPGIWFILIRTVGGWVLASKISLIPHEITVATLNNSMSPGELVNLVAEVMSNH